MTVSQLCKAEKDKNQSLLSRSRVWVSLIPYLVRSLPDMGRSASKSVLRPCRASEMVRIDIEKKNTSV